MDELDRVEQDKVYGETMERYFSNFASPEFTWNP